jgi:exopolysaccharide biosynthesis polyprenyl glycosylphosphotransferase
VAMSTVPGVAQAQVGGGVAPAGAAAVRPLRPDHPVVALATVGLDVVALAVAYVAAGALVAVPLGAWCTVPVWVLGLWWHRLYEARRLATGDAESLRVFQAAAVSAALVVVAAWLAGLDVSRRWAFAAGLAGLVALEAGRGLRRAGVRALARRGVLAHRTLVFGANREGRGIARSLARQRWLGYQPVGFVDAHPGRAHPDRRAVDGLPVLGDDVAAAVGRAGATAVIVASSAVDPGALPGLFRSLCALDVDVRVSAGLGAVAASRVAVDPLDGIAVLSLRPAELSRAQAALKRAVDLVGAAVLLVACAPLMAAVAAAIRLTSGPGVLFRQQRVGRGGRPFTIYKFRTMVPDAEERLVEVIDLNQADGVLFKVAEDPRVTPLGARLRRWCLDELPQLFNVLRGDMSLVGPRPPLPSEAARYDEWVAGRLRVKPGITGLWQVNGRHELGFDDYVRYDLYYVENWSLSLDLWILAATVPAVLSGRGAW